MRYLKTARYEWFLLIGTIYGWLAGAFFGAMYW